MKQVNLEFLGFPDYDVTEDGRVWSHRANRYLVITISKNHHDKYAKVNVNNHHGYKKFHTVHRLVAYAFCDKHYKQKYVNHIDGDIHNNHYTNLEWCTALENNLHSMDNVRVPQFTHGLSIDLPERGKYKDRRKGRHKITQEEAIQYCEYMMQGYRGCDLRVMMGISGEVFTAFKFHREHEHKAIADRYDFSHLPNAKRYTEEQAHQACRMLQDGHTIMNTYKTLGVSRGFVRDIHKGRSYKEISKNYTW